MRLGVEAALVNGELVRGDVEVVDGCIEAVGLATRRRGAIALPGFLDLQVNGFAGVDFLSASVDEYRHAGEALLATGVTAFQPTFICAAEETLVEALRAVPVNGIGPRILGVHLEGPFLSPKRLGTHPPEHRRDPDPALLERLLAAGPVSEMTIAPELPGAHELVAQLVARGVVVSAGHTDATAEEAHEAFDAGVSTVTHVFNAMRRFQPRDPGVAGAALVRRGVVVQMILDGHHLAEETVRLIWAAAAGRAALVTDAMAGAVAGDGTYRLGSVDVQVGDGVPLRSDGVLAGTVLTMIDAVRNLYALGIDLTDAVAAATSVPARLLRRDDLGRLTVGGCADVVVLDDRLEVANVLLGGESRVLA
jgi:N-acetylglucosamine-6-phosphate deacetylase